MVSGEAVAQRNATKSWDPSAREFGRPLEAPNVPADTRNTTLEALNKILSSPKLSAFDRSIYLSIRAYQLSKVGREADSQKDIAEMGKVLPSAWPLVLSGTVPELAGGGDRAAALRTLGSALQQKPGDSWLVIAQAQVYMQIGDFPRALGLLDDALASATTATDRRSALYYRGHANFNLGQYAQAADDFDASLAGRTAKSRVSPLLWRYAAQVRTRRDARGALAKDVGQRESRRMARPDRAIPAGQAAGRRTRGRWPNPTTPPSAPTASARPPSSSPWTPSAAATSNARATSSSSPRRAARRSPNSTGRRRAS